METSKPLIKPQAIVFDMDGTLFQTETLLIPAYHNVFNKLREEGLYTGETPPEQLMLGSLGMLLEDIWKVVMPKEQVHVHRRADELLLQFELQGLQEATSKLYPSVPNTLWELHDRGVKLFVASNGLEHYVKGVAAAHQIAPLFDGLYSAGEYATTSKVDLLRRLMDDHGMERIWMVGDRSSDVEAGIKNGQTVIGCAYAGFGKEDELKGSDVLIDDFSQLLALYDQAAE
ncbi:HAD family hydrolase [Paenibacillus physcomitrellae]|uniref:MTA/SAH nucleosidase n=1 Tax=Paenibacillus physcomitrellae TaxID=1619311 RepID=A0ABQ1GY20_9BACL|nr:HAD family hydrolase [Paenibacillus physcomitrellae]GGA52653.1 MTA/SAH nucleosidase [Paenibacillus physcomitrellae]